MDSHSTTKQTKLDCVSTSSRGLTAANLAEAGTECVSTAQSISVYPLAKLGEVLQSVDELPASKHPNLAGEDLQSVEGTPRIRSNKKLLENSPEID